MIKIVTDSSVRLPVGVAEELGITIVPLSVMIDGVVYSDDFESGQFLRLMQESKNLPKTSQPPVGLFAEVFSDLASEDSQIISIHLSHTLSGTVEASRQGAMLSGVDVTVVDSGFTDQAAAFQVLEAARMAQAGASKEEILAVVAEIAEKTELYIGVSTLENLVKGGRIGRVTGLLTSLLHIRLVMEMVDYALKPVVKGRGSKTFSKWLEQFATKLSQQRPVEIAISYAGQPELAETFRDYLQPLVVQPISLLETSSVIQTHTGEGAWAVMVRYE